MTPNIDAECVYELTKDWPREVKCDHMEAIHPGTHATPKTYYADRDGNAIEPETVYWAHLGSGLAWLAKNNNSVNMYPRGGEVVVAFEVPTPPQSAMRKYYKHTGPHPLAAVSAAVLAAVKGEA